MMMMMMISMKIPERVENGLEKVADVEGKPSEEEDQADSTLQSAKSISLYNRHLSPTLASYNHHYNDKE